MSRYTVQHEFDDEPTCVIDNMTDESVVTFAPTLAWEFRLPQAVRLCELLNKETQNGQAQEDRPGESDAEAY